MIYIYGKTLVRVRWSAVLDSTTHKLHIFQNHKLSPSPKSISTTSNQHSFTVTYLINSCGLSPETALSASKHINFETPDKPDSVLTFFKNHGFTKTQISNLARKQPTLLLYDPKKTLLPKFEFFYSKGMSSKDLAKMLSASPMILKRSLKNQIIPSLNMFKNLFHSDDKFIAAFKRFPKLVGLNHNAITVPNIEILRQHGVPDSNIVFLLTAQARSFSIESDQFKEIVEDVKKMGFDPLKVKFVIAVHALRSMSKSTWKRKVEVYKRWGWSEEDTMLAFRRHPWCMVTSEKKIMAVMDFFVNTMGLESSLIVHCPGIMGLSLEKRIVPRCSVLQVLLLKGLITKRISLATLLKSTESVFLQKFVTGYKEEAPHLLKLYQAKMDLAKE